MLSYLHIKNMATVTALEVDFGGGFNTVTGETGAGKSLLLGALQLVLGERADKSVIRSGEKRCEIVAVFDLPQDYANLRKEAEEYLDQHGIPCEDTEGQVFVRRVITPSSSRGFVNDTPVTLDVLRNLGELLVDIHGPGEHQSLLQPSCQLDLLDSYGDMKELREQCSEAYREIEQAQAKLDQVYQEELSPAEQELLQHQLSEIDDAELQKGEEEELQQKYEIQSHSRRLLEICRECVYGLEEGENAVVEQMRPYVQLLEEFQGIVESEGADFVNRSEEIITTLQELSNDIGSFADGVEIDEEQLAWMEERLNTIQNLKRKYGGNISDVLQKGEEIREKLNSLANRSATLEELENKLHEARRKHADLCSKLSEARESVGKDLGETVADKLQNLGFNQCQFEVHRYDVEGGPRGADRIEFCFAPNPGESPQPLRKIASSGEAARVMLAIKTVLSSADEVPVLIFDEVDANVGGQAAGAVAEEIARIAQQHQVLCITHLPQIAAVAHNHFQVNKDVVDERTETRILPLESDGRVAEITRMMGDTESSETARKHAVELLKGGTG